MKPSMGKIPMDLYVESYSDISLLPVAAQQALAKAEIANVEQGESWLENLIGTVFSNDSEIYFYALYSGRDLQVLLPVRLVNDRHTQRIESLGNFYTSLYQPFFSSGVSPDSLAFMLRKILAEHPEAVSLRLSPMDVCGRQYQLLMSATCIAGLAGFPFFCFGNWYLRVKDSWPIYLAQRSSQVRRTIKRKSKEFRSAGGVIELIFGGEQLEYGIRAYTSVYLASWKVPEPYPEFTPGLIRMLARKGWLRLGVASIEGRAIAAQIWIVAHGKASIFKLAYHEEFKQYSAGTLLTASLMAHVTDVDCVNEVDYLIGDDNYKAAWMSERRERWGIIAYNLKTFRGLVSCGRERIVRVLKALISKNRRPGMPVGAGPTR